MADRGAATSARGSFVVVEGGDGSGKTTQLSRIGEMLDAVVTHEPGGTALGAQLRAMLLGGDPLGVRTEALLMAADRAHHVDTVIRPALDAGRNVVCSRFSWSTFAYQGAGRGLCLDTLTDLDAFARGGLEPDVVLVLDLDPGEAARRRGMRGPEDHMEDAGVEFHRRVRDKLVQLAQQHPCGELIDASLSPEEITEAIVEALERHGICP